MVQYIIFFLTLHMKSFVISLDTDQGHERRQAFFQECDYAGIARPEWVKGVNPRADEFDKDSLSRMCQLTCSYGAIGAGMAHKSIYKQHAGEERVMIFEDDAVLANGFSKRLHQALKDVPGNFDILLLGCQASCGTGSKGVHPVESVLGLHAYVISRSGMEKMNNTLLNDHIDIQMGQMAKRGQLNMFYVTPDIATAKTEDMKSSSISPPKSFPNGVTAVMNVIYNEKTLPHSRHFTSERRRIGPVGINNFHVLFLAFGTLLGHNTYIYMLFALDVALFESLSELNTLSTIAFYVAGAFLHDIIRKIM